MMTQTEKQNIAASLAEYCRHYGSQNKAANSLKGVSSAIVSKVLNNDWELISDEMWRKIAAGIDHTSQEWAIVETNDFQTMTALLSDAQQHSNTLAVVGNAGTGKTMAIKQYCKSHKRAMLLCCNEYWNRKMFMQELLQCMGRDYSGYTVGELMAEIVRNLKMMDRPLIVMDEADKLSDQVLYFFISLYNSLEDHCGILLSATDHLEKRVLRGIKLNKKGYKEIYSRIGRRFIALPGVGSRDVMQICMANGVTDEAKIKEVVEDCEWDLRRVKRKIHALTVLS